MWPHIANGEEMNFIIILQIYETHNLGRASIDLCNFKIIALIGIICGRYTYSHMFYDGAE